MCKRSHWRLILVILVSQIQSNAAWPCAGFFTDQSWENISAADSHAGPGQLIPASARVKRFFEEVEARQNKIVFDARSEGKTAEESALFHELLRYADSNRVFSLNNEKRSVLAALVGWLSPVEQAEILTAFHRGSSTEKQQIAVAFVDSISRLDYVRKEPRVLLSILAGVILGSDNVLGASEIMIPATAWVTSVLFAKKIHLTEYAPAHHRLKEKLRPIIAEMQREASDYVEANIEQFFREGARPADVYQLLSRFQFREETFRLIFREGIKRCESAQDMVLLFLLTRTYGKDALMEMKADFLEANWDRLVYDFRASLEQIKMVVKAAIPGPDRYKYIGKALPALSAREIGWIFHHPIHGTFGADLVEIYGHLIVDRDLGFESWKHMSEKAPSYWFRGPWGGGEPWKKMINAARNEWELRTALLEPSPIHDLELDLIFALEMKFRLWDGEEFPFQRRVKFVQEFLDHYGYPKRKADSLWHAVIAGAETLEDLNEFDSKYFSGYRRRNSNVLRYRASRLSREQN